MIPGRQYDIHYSGEDGRITIRTIDVLAVHRHNGVTYIRAFCRLRNEKRTFREDRIFDVSGCASPLRTASENAAAENNFSNYMTDGGYSHSESDGWCFYGERQHSPEEMIRDTKQYYLRGQETAISILLMIFFMLILPFFIIINFEVLCLYLIWCRCIKEIILFSAIPLLFTWRKEYSEQRTRKSASEAVPNVNKPYPVFRAQCDALRKEHLNKVPVNGK